MASQSTAIIPLGDHNDGTISNISHVGGNVVVDKGSCGCCCISDCCFSHYTTPNDNLTSHFSRSHSKKIRISLRDIIHQYSVSTCSTGIPCFLQKGQSANLRLTESDQFDLLSTNTNHVREFTCKQTNPSRAYISLPMADWTYL